MFKRFVRGTLSTEWPQVLGVLTVIAAVLAVVPAYVPGC